MGCWGILRFCAFARPPRNVHKTLSSSSSPGVCEANVYIQFMTLAELSSSAMWRNFVFTLDQLWQYFIIFSTYSILWNYHVNCKRRDSHRSSSLEMHSPYSISRFERSLQWSDREIVRELETLTRSRRCTLHRAWWHSITFDYRCKWLANDFLLQFCRSNEFCRAKLICPSARCVIDVAFFSSSPLEFTNAILSELFLKCLMS